MKELEGHECHVEFDMPATKWPVNGFPARVCVESVDMPMIKMSSIWGGPSFWINVSKITTIKVAQ